jgi:hypothetical protein
LKEGKHTRQPARATFPNENRTNFEIQKRYKIELTSFGDGRGELLAKRDAAGVPRSTQRS